MKLSDLFFLAGIVLAIVGAISGLFLFIGVGVVVFVLAMGIRQVTRPAQPLTEETNDTEKDH